MLAVRDALYAFYTDASDPRFLPLLGPEAPFQAYVLAAYRWSRRVAFALASRRGETGLALRASLEAMQAAHLADATDAIERAMSEHEDALLGLRSKWSRLSGALMQAGELVAALP